MRKGQVHQEIKAWQEKQKGQIRQKMKRHTPHPHPVALARGRIQQGCADESKVGMCSTQMTVTQKVKSATIALACMHQGL